MQFCDVGYVAQIYFCMHMLYGSAIYYPRECTLFICTMCHLMNVSCANENLEIANTIYFK
jgi:hypothetical protein